MEGPFATAFRASKYASLPPSHYTKQVLTAPPLHRLKGDFGLKHAHPIPSKVNTIPPVKSMDDVNKHYKSIIESLKSQYIRVKAMDTRDGHHEHRSAYTQVSRLERWKELFPPQSTPDPVYAKLDNKALDELNHEEWVELVKKAKSMQERFRLDHGWVSNPNFSTFSAKDNWYRDLGFDNPTRSSSMLQRFQSPSVAIATPSLHQPTYTGPAQQNRPSFPPLFTFTTTAAEDEVTEPVMMVPGRRVNPAYISRDHPLNRNALMRKEKYSKTSIESSVAVGGFIAALVDSTFSGVTVHNRFDHVNAVTKYKVIEARIDNNGHPYIVLSRDLRHSKRKLSMYSP